MSYEKVTVYNWFSSAGTDPLIGTWRMTPWVQLTSSNRALTVYQLPADSQERAEEAPLTPSPASGKREGLGVLGGGRGAGANARCQGRRWGSVRLHAKAFQSPDSEGLPVFST